MIGVRMAGARRPWRHGGAGSLELTRLEQAHAGGWQISCNKGEPWSGRHGQISRPVLGILGAARRSMRPYGGKGPHLAEGVRGVCSGDTYR